MKDVIEQAIREALGTLGIEAVFVVEHPRELSHGDYSTNAAMVAAKIAGKNPREFADALVKTFEGTIEYVEKIEIAGPGFINFTLARDFFTGETARIREEAEAWGKNEKEKGEVVLIEYTSPNLFKPLHVGNLVGNIVGESFTRLFEASGAVVRRMNYPSDIGLTVAKGVWGLTQTNGDPNDIAALGEAYRIGNEAYESDAEKKAEIESVNRALYEGSNERLNELREQGILTSKKRLREILKLLGTHFDVEITESEASPVGKKIVEENISSNTSSNHGVFTKSDGAVIFDAERFDSSLHTRVFINSQGLPTYEAKDIGHFVLKQETYPDWTWSIIVTGNEQTEYFRVVFAALTQLFPEIKNKSLEHIPTGFLTLTTGKMSSRKGNVLTGESLLQELQEAAKVRAAETRADDVDVLAGDIAVAALKYQILRHSVGSNIIFDKSRALSFEGDSGPYLQYTHARIVSVLRKADVAGIVPDIRNAPSQPFEIERLLYRFPEVIGEALDERAPHLVTGYLIELAGAFNAFYATERIADASDEFAPYKAAVADATRQTLKNGLWLLGIKAPEKM